MPRIIKLSAIGVLVGLALFFALDTIAARYYTFRITGQIEIDPPVDDPPVIVMGDEGFSYGGGPASVHAEVSDDSGDMPTCLWSTSCPGVTIEDPTVCTGPTQITGFADADGTCQIDLSADDGPNPPTLASVNVVTKATVATNEPAGWVEVWSQSLDQEPPYGSDGENGYRTFNAEPNNIAAVTDPTAWHPTNKQVLQITYPIGFQGAAALAGFRLGQLPDGVGEFYIRGKVKRSHVQDGRATKLFFPDPEVDDAHNSFVTDNADWDPDRIGWQTQDGSPAGGECGTEPFLPASGTSILGEWWQIEARVKANTPGADDGEVQIWVNAAEALNDTTECIYDSGANPTFAGFYFDPTWGLITDFVAGEPMYLWLDDWYVSVPPPPPPDTTISATYTATCWPMNGSNQCLAPCSCNFDATATTDTARTRPFHSLQYDWEYNDSVGGTWAVSGKPKNSDKGGAIRGHVYTQAGSFTPDLTVSNSSGATDTFSAVSPIVVIAPTDHFTAAETYCFYNTSLGLGCPLDTDQDGDCDEEPTHCVALGTPGDFDVALLATCNIDSVDRLCLFKGGDTFTASTSIVNNASTDPTIIAPYGTGRPIINAPGVGLLPRNNSDTWTFHGFDLRMNGAFFTGEVGGNWLSERITIFNNILSGNLPSCSSGGTRYTFDSIGAYTRFFSFVENDCTATTGSAGVMFFGTMGEKSIIMGNILDKGGFQAGEFTTRLFPADRFVIAHNRIARHPHTPLKSAIQIRTDDEHPVQYGVINDNWYSSDTNAVLKLCQEGGCNSCPSTYCAAEDLQPVRDILFEGNYVTRETPMYSPDGSGAMFTLGGTITDMGDVTIRNNVINMQGDTIAAGRSINALSFADFIGNTIYHPAIPAGQTITVCASGAVCSGNLRRTAGAGAFSWGTAADAPNVTLDMEFGGGVPPAPDDATLADFEPAAGSNAVGGGYDADARTDQSMERDALGTLRPASEGAGAIEYTP